eukprot:1158625-Pelagomonas_calceolata.AAC.5
MDSHTRDRQIPVEHQWCGFNLDHLNKADDALVRMSIRQIPCGCSRDVLTNITTPHNQRTLTIVSLGVTMRLRVREADRSSGCTPRRSQHASRAGPCANCSIAYGYS